MRSVLLLLMMASLPFIADAQAKEFEGEVRYLHLFKYKKFVSDTSIVIKQFGNSSYFYYKNGSYSWKFNGADMQQEYSVNSTKKVYAKYKNNDSLFSIKSSPTDTILSYSIKRNVDTILGTPVDELTVVVAKKENKNMRFTRRLYYSSKYPILPQHYSHLYNFANNQVYKIMKAIPLRIEIENDAWPLVVRYEAVKIIPRAVTPAELQIPKGAKIKN